MNRADLVWTVFPDAASFLKHARAVFLTDEVRFGLALGVAENIAQGRLPHREGNRWGMATQDGQVVALYQQTLPYPMIWMPRRAGLEGALLEHLEAQGGLPERMQGTEAVIKQLGQVRCDRSGEQIREGLSMRCQRLDAVRFPATLPPGRMRVAKEGENELLCQWSYRFAVDCGLREQVARGRPERAPHLDEQNLFVWDVEDSPVACAALTRESPRGRTISLVYTPDAMRGRGYASALVGTLSQHVLDSGKSFVSLYTDRKNPTSNKIYHELGYRPVEDALVLEFVAP